MQDKQIEIENQDIPKLIPLKFEPELYPWTRSISKAFKKIGGIGLDYIYIPWWYEFTLFFRSLFQISFFISLILIIFFAVLLFKNFFAFSMTFITFGLLSTIGAAFILYILFLLTSQICNTSMYLKPLSKEDTPFLENSKYTDYYNIIASTCRQKINRENLAAISKQLSESLLLRSARMLAEDMVRLEGNYKELKQQYQYTLKENESLTLRLEKLQKLETPGQENEIRLEQVDPENTTFDKNTLQQKNPNSMFSSALLAGNHNLSKRKKTNTNGTTFTPQSNIPQV